MRSKILAVGVALVLSGCVAGEYNGPPSMSVPSDASANKSYALTTSDDVARVGETSQRFEIRHDDCGNTGGVMTDCRTDRRRVELNEDFSQRLPRAGETRWYGWSIYIPQDFPDLTPTNTTLGQIKLRNWRSPLWAFLVQNNAMQFDYRPYGQQNSVWCQAIPLSQMRGRWTDIVVYANYNFEQTNNQPMLQLWINGKLVCSDDRPLITREMIRTTGYDTISIKYGIYNSYVSRWLNEHKTHPVSANGWEDYHVDSGVVHDSIAARPFEIDWGVELPTQVVYYDEVRIGRTREDVDVRLRYPN